MSASGRVLITAAVLALIGIGRPATAAGERAAPPRYRLTVGQELEYRSSSTLKHESGSSAYNDELTAWVVRANDGGGWRIVVRSAPTASHDGKTWREPFVSLAYFDLAPDGTLVANESFGPLFDPTSLFPRLPRDANQVARGWEDARTCPAAVNIEGTSRFKVIDAGEGDRPWVFEEARETPLDKIYGLTAKYRYTFDPGRGVVARTEDEYTQSYAVVGKGAGTTELVATERRDAEWIAELAAESDRYFAASKAHGELMARAESEPVDAKTMAADAVGGALARINRRDDRKYDPAGSPLLVKARETLTKARDVATLPLIRDLLDAQIMLHDRTAPSTREAAVRRARVVDKPAADWESKDLEGKIHRLKDYRGRVVVLDFWYRGCGWCMRAMPQLNQLADDFRSESVALLGMCTDSEEKDAKFVAEAMHLNYPVLKAEGLTRDYSIQGFPTLILIGPDGMVRDVHVGYTPTLREDVGRAIRRLLLAK